MTPLLRLAAGAGAGIVGMSATYPLDMVRGRLTVQGERKTSQYRGIWDCTRQIVKQARPHVPPRFYRLFLGRSQARADICSATAGYC